MKRRENSSREGPGVIGSLETIEKIFYAAALLAGRRAYRHKIALIGAHRTIPERKGQAILPGLVLFAAYSVTIVCTAILVCAAALFLTVKCVPGCAYCQEISSSSDRSLERASRAIELGAEGSGAEGSGAEEAGSGRFAAEEPGAAESGAGGPMAGEFRALWVLRNTLVSEREIDRMLREAKDAGFNVLFAQVRGRGDAFYNSSIESRAELLSQAGFDPLAYLVAEAHRNGFEVHAWLNVFLVWSASWKPANTKHALFSHPEWVAVRSDGKALSELSRGEFDAMGIEGVFLAPGNPEVRQHIRAVIRELVQNYDLDGVHLDYIRYPDMAVGYDQGTRTEFMRRYGVDPVQIANGREGLIDFFGDKGLQDLGVLWDKWRVSNLDELVDSVRCDLRALNPRVRLSAAVIADQRSATDKYGQDWPSWLRRGMIDFAVPMCYSASTRFVQNQVRSIQSIVEEGKFYPGIAMYNQSPGRVVEKVRALRRVGVTGFSMFCYDPERPRGAVLRELSRSVFALPAEPWGETRR